MFALLIVVFIVLLISAVCSGIEASLFSVSIQRVRQLASETSSKSAMHLVSIKEHMERPIAALVFANNAANILGTMLITKLADSVFDSFWLGVFSGVLTLSIIIFAEIVPKTIGEMYDEHIALSIATSLRVFTWLMTPIMYVIGKITYPITKHKKPDVFDADDIQFLTQLSQSQGSINADESKMIHQVFKMADVTAKQIMTPRVNMSFFYGSDDIESIKTEIVNSEHSRIIVVDETPDEIIGVVCELPLS